MSDLVPGVDRLDRIDAAIHDHSEMLDSDAIGTGICECGFKLSDDRYHQARQVLMVLDSDAEQASTPDEVGRPLQHNEAPIAVVKTVRCRGCGKRAPWCSCGAADYHDLTEQHDDSKGAS